MRKLNNFALLAVCCSFLITAVSFALDGKKLKASPTFLIGEDIMCTVSQSSESKEVGKKLSFIGLKSDHPKVLLEDGVTSPLKKVFESAEVLSLVLVASGSGSVDAFVIDKKSGKFSRAAAGSFIETYAVGSLGVCQ